MNSPAVAQEPIFLSLRNAELRIHPADEDLFVGTRIRTGFRPQRRGHEHAKWARWNLTPPRETKEQVQSRGFPDERAAPAQKDVASTDWRGCLFRMRHTS